MNDLNLADFFCFADGRSNFDIDPVRDAAFLFGDEKWGEGIRQQLRRSIVLDRPLRLVWIGQYGIGKTHRIHHTMHIIQSDQMDILPVEVTCTDIGDKTGFESLQYQLVNNLGFSAMRDHARKYMRRVADGDPGVTTPESLSSSMDVANAIRTLGGDNDALAREAWRYLAGLSLAKDGRDAELINVTKPALNTSVEYASALGLLGTLIRAEAGKRLLYLVDQMEATSKITNKAMAARWVETLRAILDLKTVGLVVAIGAESANLDDLPRILLEPEIVRRFGQDNYHSMEHFRAMEMEKFLRQMLKVWVDQDCLVKVADQEGWTSAPDFDVMTYPFTSPAFERLTGHLSADATRAKPSVVIETLNTIAADAFISGVRLIDDAVLDGNGINA